MIPDNQTHKGAITHLLGHMICVAYKSHGSNCITFGRPVRAANATITSLRRVRHKRHNILVF